ncbi:MAG: hypothetical protein AAGH15_03710 [Myxococcota bacterium]
MKGRTLGRLAALALATWALPAEAQLTEAGADDLSSQPARETECTGRIDEDGDGLTDCADSDCYDVPECRAGGAPENNDEACSDWIDNDGDGVTDCEDPECAGPGLTVCLGSDPAGGSAPPRPLEDEGVPPLTRDLTGDDLIGNAGDVMGENNDYLCSDGVDNDGDGRTDCADFGCRFDPQVTVCTGRPGFRFSVVAGIFAEVNLEEQEGRRGDVNFARLQLRALGPIPYIHDSFFLLSMRMERSPRLTFAHFQVPLSSRGHYIAVNSGSGSLSTGLIVSTSKQPLLDPPFYLFNAFEQGNGAAIEAGGPLNAASTVLFRVFAAGGSGRFRGNVGGRFFPNDDQNFTYLAGAQLQLDLIGHFSRFDSPFLYTRVPLGLGVTIGAKYDQRALERYPAGNAFTQFQYGPFLLRAETYMKYTIDFGGSFQYAWNAQVSLLLWERNLMLAADIGQFKAEAFTGLPDTLSANDLGPEDTNLQWRVALHYYWFRNIGILSLRYDEEYLEDDGDDRTPDTNRTIRVETQFRF